jgi:hypothetical protein
MSTLSKPEFLERLDNAVKAFGQSKSSNGMTQDAVCAAREAKLPAYAEESEDLDVMCDYVCPITQAVILSHFGYDVTEYGDAKDDAWRHYLATAACRLEAPRIRANMSAFGW